MGGTIDRFIDATFAVPTRSEAYKYAAYAFGTNAKARISGFPEGLVKLVCRVSDKGLLGVHIA